MAMMLIALTILAASPLTDALQRAAPSQTQVEVTGWQAPTDCAGNDFEPARVESSGRVPVRVRGPKCEGWGWATVRVFTNALVLTKDVGTGVSIGGAYTTQRVEYRRGTEPLREVDADANAAKLLKAGTMLTPEMVRSGPPIGSALTVRVVMGGLSLEQQGTVIACRGSNVCASLPSGKRVEGKMVSGLLLVGGAP